jgi:O-methyltransferase
VTDTASTTSAPSALRRLPGKGIRAVRRAARRLGRVLQSTPVAAFPADPDTVKAADGAKRLRTGQVRRLRDQLATVERERDRLAAELAATRHSVLQPDWTVQLDDRATTTISAVLEERLSYLPEHNLRALASIVAAADRDGLAGLVVECGTARGGSAIAIAAAKAADRPMRVYDIFGTIPPPTDQDGPDVHARYQRILSGHAKGKGGDTYYGYRPNLYDEVTDSFTRLLAPPAELNVTLVKGLFADTIAIEEPVAFAHLDGDWYESTMTCLTRIAPLVVPGGRIVLDDYYAWSGCRAAVDEYFGGRDGFRLEQRAKLHVIRE